MEYGIRQLRRAWLGPEDVLNTLDAGDLRPPSAQKVHFDQKRPLSVQFRVPLVSTVQVFMASGASLRLR